jgi:hypothetical protein
MTRRLAFLLVALAVIGFGAMPLYNAWVDPRVFPLRTSLPVAGKEFSTSTFTLEPDYHYRIEISADNAVPYADCLLGAGSDALSGDCTRYPSALSVTWLLRDTAGRVLASGPSSGDLTAIGYGGDNVSIIVGNINISRKSDARLTFHYRRSAVALAPLRPTLSVYDLFADKGAGINEVLLGLLSVVLAGAGGIMLAVTRRRS